MFLAINTEYAIKINAELDRLAVGTGANAYNGLMVESVDDAEVVVKIFDDYVSGKYYADQVLACLESLAPGDVTLNDEPDNIWQAISKFEI